MTHRQVPGLLAAVAVGSPALIGATYSMLAAVGLAGVGAQGFTPDRIISVLTSSQTWSGVSWTIVTSGVATAVGVVLAFLVAVRVRTSRVGQAVATLPMAVPHVAAALAALLMLGQSGLVSRVTYAIGLTAGPADFPPLVYDRAGVSLVVAFLWKELPYLTLTAVAILLTDTRELEEVARTLGATPRQAFWRVTWPRLWRGTAPAAIAAFAFLIGQYEMPALLAPSHPAPLSILIYERAVDPNLARRGEAHVLGLLALFIAALLVVAHMSWRARAESESR
jgi:putative spermidine/putrescine transport system permease protein